MAHKHRVPDVVMEAAAAFGAAQVIRDRAFALYQTSFAGGSSQATCQALFEAHNAACDDVAAARLTFETLLRTHPLTA